MWLDPGYGYDVDVTTGVAKGNEEQSIYAVMSGTHYGSGCCFDCASPPIAPSVSCATRSNLNRPLLLVCCLLLELSICCPSSGYTSA